MQPTAGGGADGFAVIDAMIALLILSVTIIGSLEAVETGKRAAVAAEESRRATTLLRYLVDSAPDSVGEQSGRADGFAWRLEVTAGSPSGIATTILCDRTAGLISEKTGRRFQLATEAICAPPKTS